MVADVVRVSAKAGIGIEDLVQTIIDKVPAPSGDPEATLQAMVFDSHYDEYRGAITYLRVDERHDS